MSFFRRLLGKSNPASEPQPQHKSAPDDSELVTVYDKYGRPIQIAKREWREKVLGPNLKQAWDQPEQLYNFILGAFNDKLYLDVEEAAKRLAAIDPHPDRGATMLAIVYQQTGRASEAESTLLDHLQKHGEDGVVLTNLANAQDALGRHAEAMQTLWRALQLDPNQDMALLWYEVVEREKNGKPAGLDAFRRVAELPGSWRAQLWIARAALEDRDLDRALELYEQSLNAAGEPAPADALQQITSDLGQRGHLLEAVSLVGPRYDFERHGLQVGNNLIKAYFDLGQLDHARALITQLQTLQRPDYQEHLAYWENAVSKADFETRPEPQEESMRIEVVPVSGPLWLKQDHPIAGHFPQKSPDAPLVVFTGCSVDHPSAPSKVTATPSDSSGRFSRSLPLYLTERIHLETTLRARAPIPMAVTQGGGLVVTSDQTSPERVAQLARMVADPSAPEALADYAFDTHLKTQGENWTLHLRLIRVIDAKVVFENEYKLPEHGFHQIGEQFLADVYAALKSEAELDASPVPPPHTRIQNREIDHYLLRLEQSLAARCAVNLQASESFLYNPTEILSGMIHLCIQNPDHLPSRFILWRALDAIRQLQPALARSFAPKVAALQSEHPIAHPAYEQLTAELNSTCAP